MTESKSGVLPLHHRAVETQQGRRDVDREGGWDAPYGMSTSADAGFSKLR